MRNFNYISSFFVEEFSKTSSVKTETVQRIVDNLLYDYKLNYPVLFRFMQMMHDDLHRVKIDYPDFSSSSYGYANYSQKVVQIYTVDGSNEYLEKLTSRFYTDVKENGQVDYSDISAYKVSSEIEDPFINLMQFIGYGLSGRSESLLSHEITHMVLDDINSNIYPKHDILVQSVCNTLRNVEKRAFNKIESTNCEQDYHKYGLHLYKRIFGDNDGEPYDVITKVIPNGLKHLSVTGLIGAYTFLQPFVSSHYDEQGVECEIIPRLLEVQYTEYASADMIEDYKPLKDYYCSYILPQLHESIYSSKAIDLVTFDKSIDIGCSIEFGAFAEL